MVRGLKKFGDYFSKYSDQYVLIGGAACELIMEEAGLGFRSTKDLDIVLCVEALDAVFVKTFWSFIKDGRYKIQQSDFGVNRYYRFQKPEEEEYPKVIELFSGKLDLVGLAEGGHLTPIPVNEAISSLSAILLDDSCYQLVLAGRKSIGGISIVDAEHLIPLKARAWFDLSGRRSSGEEVDSHTIKKHKNDIFRLYQVIDPGFDGVIPDMARQYMDRFLNAMSVERPDLAGLGLGKLQLDEILDGLRKVYVRA